MTFLRNIESIFKDVTLLKVLFFNDATEASERVVYYKKN